MRWIWLCVWVSVVIFELVQVAFKGCIKAPFVQEFSVVDPDLLELARQTNSCWKNASAQNIQFDQMVTSESKNSEFEGADSIVQLSELGNILGSRGVDAQLVGDLEDWFLLESRDSTPEMKKSYLRGILQWLSPHLSGKQKPVLSRVRLEPGSESIYPDLHFEMHGDPELMGSLLLEASGTQGNWRLKQMELLCRNSTDIWWMQGNCSYDPVGME